MREGVEKRREKGDNIPDVPGEVLAPGEDHATVAVSFALEGLCRGCADALCDACVSGGRVRGGRERGRGRDCDGGHVGVGVEGVVVVGELVVLAVLVVEGGVVVSCARHDLYEGDALTRRSPGNERFFLSPCLKDRSLPIKAPLRRTFNLAVPVPWVRATITASPIQSQEPAKEEIKNISASETTLFPRSRRWEGLARIGASHGRDRIWRSFFSSSLVNTPALSTKY